MKEIDNINKEIIKNSTGIFKTKKGSIFYLLNGKYHRINGPAITYITGENWWYLNGKLHRPDGPAVEWASKEKHWFYYDIYAISKEQFYDPEWRRKIEIKVLL